MLDCPPPSANESDHATEQNQADVERRQAGHHGLAVDRVRDQRRAAIEVLDDLEQRLRREVGVAAVPLEQEAPDLEVEAGERG